MQSLVSSSVTTGSGAGGSHEAASICFPGSGEQRRERVAQEEAPGRGFSPADGTGGAKHLPSAHPARAGEDRQAAGGSASRDGAVDGRSPREPRVAPAGPEGHLHPHPHPDALPLPITAPSPRHPPARQPEALTWKRFFTQIFFMLLQSPAGPVTPAQALQDASPLPAGSPLSASRGGKRCSEHPPPPAAGDGGGRGRGSPGWALGRAGAVSMKHHWSAPPSILPPPASASAPPPALAHSDSGGGQAGHRWRGARAAAGRGAHVLPSPLVLAPRPSGVRAPCPAMRLYHCPLPSVHPAPPPGAGAALLSRAQHRGAQPTTAVPARTPTGTRMTQHTPPALHATALHALPPKCS